MSKIEYEELIAFHPGYYLREIIEDMGITQSEFAKRLDTTDKTLSKLLNGEIPLSNDIAQKLAQMLGTSVKVWLNLQNAYNEKLVEIEQRKKLDQEKHYLKFIDYNYFCCLKLVKETKKVEEKISELHKFFKVSSLSVLTKKDFLVACRTAVSDVAEKNIVNSNAWIQTAMNMAEKINCYPFNSKKLKGYLPEIRGMTLQDPQVFCPRLCEIFKECGVAFVLLPHLKNSGVNGAVKWISSEKVLLAINNRRMDADVFWFSLFHEIKHVLQQRLKETFISFDKGENFDRLDVGLEQEADTFSGDYLIPGDQYSSFIESGNFSEGSVKQFALEIGVQPGIVVGRLQHDRFLEFNRLAHLKERYKIELC
ncbi:MAG TPA: HigA family addiction module antitoxin [Methylomusa anaerophila]|uniref:Putative HTH-type transcriptional regulator YddM n=1 Tax=Methylomusa anaerophila TaxID=1930071 RepID=A0A348AI31_9FIRM|nr:HigA family addiction module antitoxin [Methylomusa anaerophila]BBB90729.1 putative HTH-type transcriptional regulator YddM [Methylomusa anaerophila]HML88668.1 HigA family addiction module antitoxin [Methylomusa anaerophila]